MKIITGLTVVSFALSTFATTGLQAQDAIPMQEQQIKAAVSAAPPNKQDGAKVLGYNTEGDLVTLREGSNELICLADDPEQTQFHVACYYEALEPFMKRGRELRAQGLNRSKVDSIRKAEIESGILDYPRKPMGLYSLSGDEEAFNYETGKIMSARPLYVVYVPYATEESTGISSAPAGKSGFWLMEPGTPWAHIMFPGQPIKADSVSN